MSSFLPLIGLPREVKHYHSLYPLEMNQQDGMSSNFGYRTICFKAINSHDGQIYLLRRVIGNKNCNNILDLFDSIKI